MVTILDISKRAFMDEAEALRTLLPSVEHFSPAGKIIMEKAANWTRVIRAHGIGHGVEALLETYNLNTSEGVALMCLAEALLRIPDAATADALIQSTFVGRQWENYLDTSDSWLLQASSWGLLLTGRVVDFGQDARAGLLHGLKALVNKLGEPVIREALRKAMRLIGSQFVLGEDMAQALKHAGPFTSRGYRFSFDILGEGARSDAQAQAYVKDYLSGIALIAHSSENAALFERPGISVKLSALHPRYQLVQQRRVMAELLPRLKHIVLAAKEANIAVSIDAEEATRLDIEMLVFEQLLQDTAFTGWDGIGFVVQAYQKRSFYLLDWLAALAQKHRRIIPLRLVKGAYWDSEIKWAQMAGLPGYPVFTRKEHTDISYLACADKILSQHRVFYPQFATHNARTVASIMVAAKERGWPPGSYEFQRLHGMGEALHDLVIRDVPTRIYAPVGTHKDLLAYLIRRLLENGANSSFVHLLMDESKTPEEILADPLESVKNAASPPIPLPPDIYPDRSNSYGMDFGNLAQLQGLQQAIAPYDSSPPAAIRDTDIAALDGMFTAAQKSFVQWSRTPVNQRAAALERAADLIEDHAAELMALCAREARRTLQDGVSEVREAADACRYYALQARRLMMPQALSSPAGESNVLGLYPRGVFACISPWNFPLAIFTAQIAAALVTGNCVIAKPAEQTPRMAALAVSLLHQAGIAREALQLAFGKGETIGSALIKDKRTSGVVFTGGTDTAQIIARQLAERGAPLIPLIAETGGQNCMVVDSSALLEQAVDDIILSAFGSAGQRCSSLRVLFVQEEVAEELLALLSGAMQELTLGDPLDPATDIGPVIDEEARQSLMSHIESMKKAATLIASVPAPAQGCFVAPHVFEIRSIDELTTEHFGPVLHAIRFKAGTLEAVADAINSTGYGLTFGIHSRVDDHIKLLASRVRAGNTYVNRSMIGATIGVQPFGGEGLSGTGPKAGGPHYLLRFLSERVLSVNSAAIGGNIALLAQKTDAR